MPSIAFCAVALAATAAGLRAQSTTESSLSGPLSPSVALATPATTYALSGIDQINYYNGSVSVQIPVATFGGRGAANVGVSVPISRQWEVIDSYDPQSGFFVKVPSYTNPTTDLSGRSYTPGYFTQEGSSANPNSCLVTRNGADYWAGSGPFLSWIVFHRPNGSETVLVDDVFLGQPQGAVNECSTSPTFADRGRTFRSYDGSGLVFVATQDLYDSDLGAFSWANGTLYFKDGTHFTFHSDYTAPPPYETWVVEDRNGNQMNYTLGTGTTNYTVTDSAGRTETIDLVDPSYVLYTITFPGTGNTQRTVTVNYAQLSDVLAAGETSKTYACLFPELNGSAATTLDAWLISSVVLADGSSYTFKYNSYGELVRLTLPTGGAYTYRYAETSSCTDTSGASGVISVNQAAGFFIYRRVLERDELADGVNITARTIYTATPVASIDPIHPSRRGTKVTVDFEDAAANVLRRENHYFYGDPSSPGALPTPDTNFPSWTDGIEFKVETGSTTSVIQTQQKAWGQRPCGPTENCWFDPQGEGVRPHDPETCQLTTQLDATLPAGIVFGYDQFNNQTDAFEFDYGAAPGIGASCPSTITLSGYTRHTAASYKIDAAYVAAPPNLVSLPISKTVYNGSNAQVAQELWSYDQNALQSAAGLAGHDDTNYGTANTVRGNVTTHQVWQNTTNTFPAETFTYDTTGSIQTYSDFKNNPTTLTYGDAAHVQPTQITNALNQSRSYAYDAGSLKLVTSTDENSVTTNYSYIDPLDRVTKVARAAGTALASGTNYAYISPTQIEVTQDRTTNNDPAPIRVDTKFDGFGRPSETDQYESTTAYIATTTSYDALGRVHTTTNPSRPGDGLNYATTYGYEPLGRTTTVTTADNSVTNTSYAGNQTTVTDPAGIKRQITSDGLGRMTGVIEDPGSSPHLNYSTTYAYDALDNLKTVTQSSQTRSFLYDSQSRLTSATNPESGTTAYVYDGNGNVVTKTSPAPNQTGTATVTTNYQYDALNRLTMKTYSDGTTRQAQYFYDNNNSPGDNRIGRLSGTWDGANTGTNYLYDPMGRIRSKQDCAQPVCNTSWWTTYTYDLSGNITSYTVPNTTNPPSPPSSFVTFTQSFDTAGRPVQLTSSLVDAQHPSTLASVDSSVGYYPSGALRKVTLGNGRTETAAYNNRLQPCRMNVNSAGGYYSQCTDAAPSGNVLDFKYGFNAGTNNGNITSWSATGNQTFSRTYTYDSLNRIATMADSAKSQSCKGLSWTIDRWGNRTDQTVTRGKCNTFHQTVNSQNQFPLPYRYDAAGNMINDGTHSYTYDAENRLIQVDGGATAAYTYDPEGRRVAKAISGTTTDYVHDLAGNVLFEAQGSTWVTAYIYFAEALHAQYKNNTTYFLHRDHLGSTRLITGLGGTTVDNLDFLPFGEQITGDTSTTHKFTGRERDAETGMDFFGARYMSAAQGRWSSPDLVNLTDDRILNPSNTINKYIYSGNNPLKYTDPDGRDITIFYQTGVPTGHIMMAAVNEQRNDFAFLSVGPQPEYHNSAGMPWNWISGVPGTTVFELDQFKTVDDLRNNFAALTIHTSPEVAQQAIDAIRNGAGTGNWAALGNNCTSACSKVLKDIGLLGPNSYLTYFARPSTFWNTLRAKYQPNLSSSQRSNLLQNSGSLFPVTYGMDYGDPRWSMPTFDWIWLLLSNPPVGCVSASDSEGNVVPPACN
jgi:RHS repeat-associated protein